MRTSSQEYQEQLFLSNLIITRMHSSMMRTGRSLTVYWRLLRGGGVPAPGGLVGAGFCSGGCAWSGGGVPGRGGGVWHPSMH